ncbi:MAG: uroporphyrinogen decarboxylase family protein [Candidatus Methanosuratus sp.]|nr:uroporphyrinogen decarboxylase family protein [Candidatus Methanosuratincola sp.]
MQDRMSSTERMGAVLMGQKPDRVPVNPFILGFAAKICNLPLGDLYTDPKKCFRTQLLCAEMYGYDATPMYAYASYGAWEFGGEIGMPYEEGQSAPYVIKHPVETPEDVDKLEVPDPKTAGSIPVSMGVGKLCYEHGMPVVFQSGEVLSPAAMIAEPSRLLSWMIRKPEVVHKLNKKIAEYFVAVAEYFTSTFGADKCMSFAGGPVESNKLINANQFAEFVYPYMKEIHSKVLGMGVPIILEHPCSDQNKNLPYYQKLREELGWKGKYIWVFGPETPLERQIEIFGKHDVLMGNVDPPSFQFKDFDEIVALCKDNIERGIKNPSGYILGVGCELPPLAPPINVYAIMKAAREYGSYK